MKNFKLIMESWRGFKTLLNERVKPESSYPTTYQGLRQMIEELSDKTWIFFDTETTGLAREQVPQAITQIAAIKVKINNFDEDKDIDIIDRFDNLIELNRKTVEGIRREEKNWPNTLEYHKKKQKEKKEKFDEAENKKQLKDPNYIPKEYKEEQPPYTMARALNMTGYMTMEELERKYNIEVLSVPEGSELREENPLNKSGGVQSAPYLTAREALTNFAQFCAPQEGEEVLLIAQNTPFDVEYINIAFRRAGIPVPNDEALDTVVIFKKYLTPVVIDLESKLSNGEVPEDQVADVQNIIKELIKVSEATGKKSSTVSLGPITKAFGVKDEGWHNALSDVIMLAKVMKKILNFLDKNEFVKTIDYTGAEKPSVAPELEQQIQELQKWFETDAFTPRDAPEGWERGGWMDKKTGKIAEPTPYYLEYTAKKEQLRTLKDELSKLKKRKPPSDGKPSTTDLSESKIRIRIKR
jgi:DNA polymerase III epsilon subunit-like protein